MRFSTLVVVASMAIAQRHLPVLQQGEIISIASLARDMSQLLERVYCGSLRKECDGACIAIDDICCDGGFACKMTETCSDDGTCCANAHRIGITCDGSVNTTCRTGEVFCGKGCMPEGNICCPDNKSSCPESTYCVDDGTCSYSNPDDSDSSDDTSSTDSNGHRHKNGQVGINERIGIYAVGVAVMVAAAVPLVL